MDTLDVMKKAENLGGSKRRDAFEDVIIAMREIGCDMRIGGGKAGGINFRYGAIGYSILDINTEGRDKLYASAHPGKDAPEEYRSEINEFIDSREELTPKSSPISSYGHLEETIEEIGAEPLVEFGKKAMSLIREYYYKPWQELHRA